MSSRDRKVVLLAVVLTRTVDRELLEPRGAEERGSSSLEASEIVGVEALGVDLSGAHSRVKPPSRRKNRQNRFILISFGSKFPPFVFS